MGNMDKKPQITKENVKALFESPYVRVADLQYAPGKHYYDATRRTMEDMVAVKPEEEFENMLPDAVSCIVILAMPGRSRSCCCPMNSAIRRASTCSACRRG